MFVIQQGPEFSRPGFNETPNDKWKTDVSQGFAVFTAPDAPARADFKLYSPNPKAIREIKESWRNEIL